MLLYTDFISKYKKKNPVSSSYTILVLNALVLDLRFFFCDMLVDSMKGRFGHFAWCFGWLEDCMDHVGELLFENLFVGFLGPMDFCIQSQDSFVSEEIGIYLTKFFVILAWESGTRFPIPNKLDFGFSFVDVLSSRTTGFGGLELTFFVPNICDKSVYFGLGISIGHWWCNNESVIKRMVIMVWWAFSMSG